ncbi:MAG: TetR/AcrR family transcriptional regulator [Desulforegulaceae bacterium]|nr:TetR/AcrR family transcriptional regulator [Desulforegulaceae bacterium]
MRIEDKEGKYSIILDSAVKVFAEFGVENSTVSKIAAKAGVADGTIYLYFKNKKDILIKFADDRGEKIFRKFEEAVNSGKDSKEKLFNLIYSHIENFSKNKDLAVVYQCELSKIHGCQPKIRELSIRYRQMLKDIFLLGQSEGRVSKNVDLDFIKDLVSGSINEIINTYIVKENKNIDILEASGKLVDFIFKGLG